MHKHLVTIAVAMALGAVKIASAAPVEFNASGALPSEIQATFDGFRNSLGTDNKAGPASTTGHREINWDGASDAVSAPNLMPANQFAKRGVIFFTPGSGFQLSAKAVNPTNTPTNFANIAPNLAHEFQAFSPERLFTALDSSVTEVLFFAPGTTKAASVDAFGSVFSNVAHYGSTKIEYFDANGTLLHTQTVQPGTIQHASLSFAGTVFDAGERVYMVRITSGNVELGADGGMFPNPPRGQAVDLVVMDDFVYSEPQPLVTP
jgi:hypothetical protein